MATTPPPLTPFSGLTPQRSDKTTFSARVDAFITWFIACVAQFVAITANVYANAQEAFISAGTATSAAATAAATANVTLWVSGATIQQYASVIAPADGRTYRRTSAAGSSTTDPSLDSVNYVLLSGQPSTLALLGQYAVSTAVATIDFSTIFSTAGFDSFVVMLPNLRFSGADRLGVRVWSGGSVQVAATYFGFGPDNSSTVSDTALLIPNNTVSLSGALEFLNPSDTLNAKAVLIRGMSSSTSGAISRAGQWSSTQAITGFRLFLSSGSNFTAGTVRVYGIRNT